ncbi:MAG: fimbrillin family protein [Bacteroides sp.]|nr:fimbrillin family protein [Bacteroides sp.]
MRNLNSNLWYPALAFSCLLLLAGCDKDTLGAESNEPVELQIAPTVALTRSAIQGGEQKGTGATVMQNVAVYAAGDDYTSAKGNNHAVYLQNNGNWTSDGTNGNIYLTNKKATVYAYYPAYASDGTTFQPINENDVTINSTIPVSVLETGTIAVVNNASTNDIACAADEVDYMYANIAEADNTSAKRSIALTMNHALSMVSFRIYKENYTEDGKLTKIVLKNASGKTVLTKGTSQAMNITTGTITQTASSSTSYTRTLSNEYVLATSGAAANKLSMLVFPVTSSIQASTIEAEFVIDGATYTTSITAPAVVDTDGQWKAGNNNIYTVKLSGTELSVTKVDVVAWVEKVVDSDLTIN